MNLQDSTTFPDDRKLEDKFAPTIKGMLATHFIRKVESDDLEKGRDFAIYKVQPFSVAVRLRRHRFFRAFRDEFTIRWSRPRGTKTEIDKIREGTVNYLFYGFLSPDETFIIQYFLADLKEFGNPEPAEIILNKTKDSELAVFKLNQFPKSFIVRFWCHKTYERSERS